MTEHFGTGSKKGRGRARRSIDLVEAMHAAAEAAQPISVRGIAYKLFAAGLIASMSRSEMARVYRLLLQAREQGDVPWHWVVDETRRIERVATWNDPAQYARVVAHSYRRDFWNQQPVRVEVWSEKGTVRGLLSPVLRRYAISFRALHGFSGATTIHNVSDDDDGRKLIVLYVGDYDPSGMFMSEADLPARFSKYGGDHVTLKRIALTREHVTRLPSFSVAAKRKTTAQLVSRPLRRSLLGTRCDGPQRPSRLCRDGDQGLDRARGVGTLQGRQRGGAGVAEDDPRGLEGAMNRRARRAAAAVRRRRTRFYDEYVRHLNPIAIDAPFEGPGPHYVARLHDSWCSFFHTGNVADCNCNPDIVRYAEPRRQ